MIRSKKVKPDRLANIWNKCVFMSVSEGAKTVLSHPDRTPYLPPRRLSFFHSQKRGGAVRPLAEAPVHRSGGSRGEVPTESP